MIIPANVILEVSALCNLSCLGCALHGPHRFVTRPSGNMKAAVWRAVIKDLGSLEQKVSLTTHGGGEPLLHPALRDILRYARTFSNLEIGFLTNGMLLDKSWSDFLTDIKLDWIAFSIDGVLPETHDRIRKYSDLKRVEENLDTLLAVKRRKKSVFPQIRLNMVAYDEIVDQQEAFVEKWIHKVDAVMISHYRQPPESKRWPGITIERKPCNLLWYQAVVSWDGRLALCCEDFNVDFSPGRIAPGNSLLSLWNNEAMSRVRDLHTRGDYDQHSMCCRCDTWAEDYSRQEYVDDERGFRVVKTPSQIVYSREPE